MKVSLPIRTGHWSGSTRRLAFEPLEERRMLAASPWQNPIWPLDVNHDGVVSPVDALNVINRISDDGVGNLPATVPGDQPDFYCDTTGDNVLSAVDVLKILNRLNAPPQVVVSTLVPFTIDLTPQITVVATSSGPLPDGTPVQLDIDLNNDGDFLDAGESNYTAVTLLGGKAVFELNPALAPSPAAGPYVVKLRARLTDGDGMQGISDALPLKVDTQMSNALKDYVETDDNGYDYAALPGPIFVDPGGQYSVYDVFMTSQRWRSAAEVNTTLWSHWVQIVVPTTVTSTTALMLIDGGSIKTTPPGPIAALVALAVQSHSVVVDLPTVPNEPLSFTDDVVASRSEDAIIAYTFDQYMDHLGEPGNETWPLLLPMVKSAVKAMDTVQDFVPKVNGGNPINDFVVTGYSKRGWTTWLTAAVDDRVRAIIPGVFDNLNQGPQMVHHFGAYGFFSKEIKDYNDLDIFQRIITPEGEQLSQIVDPYRYLNNGHFNIPKLILNSAGDQFFVSDSAQFYIHDLPGTDNYLRYLPNTGHGLDARASESTASFYDAILNNRVLPKFSWVVQPDGTIVVHSDDTPTQVLMWQATSANRDFRFGQNPAVVWTNTALSDQGGGLFYANVPVPDAGSTAYFAELTFPSAIPGNPYVFTTEIRVQTKIPLHPFDLSGDTAEPSALPALPPDDTSAIAPGLWALMSLVTNASAQPTAMLSVPFEATTSAGGTVTASARPTVELTDAEWNDVLADDLEDRRDADFDDVLEFALS